jgi:23S rRNA (uridine2552-2'-O)-methyltransferase
VARGGDRSHEDAYSRRAREQGYPARSVFKLEEIDRRTDLLRPQAAVLDLGAAPGSWSLYALDRIGAGGSVTAVDLAPLPGALAAHVGPRLQYLQMDMGSEQLAQTLDGVEFDVVLSDAAPATSGNRIVDTAKSEQLLDVALLLATERLRSGGALVAKLLQGGDVGQLLRTWREHFAHVRTMKPAASRAESTELFVIGLDYRTIH